MVRVKNQLQYKQFLEEVYPELAAVATMVDLITAQDDIYSVYRMWCFQNGKEE